MHLVDLTGLKFFLLFCFLVLGSVEHHHLMAHLLSVELLFEQAVVLRQINIVVDHGFLIRLYVEPVTPIRLLIRGLNIHDSEDKYDSGRITCYQEMAVGGYLHAHNLVAVHVYLIHLWLQKLDFVTVGLDDFILQIFLAQGPYRNLDRPLCGSQKQRFETLRQDHARDLRVFDGELCHQLFAFFLVNAEILDFITADEQVQIILWSARVRLVQEGPFVVEDGRVPKLI